MSAANLLFNLLAKEDRDSLELTLPLPPATTKRDLAVEVSDESLTIRHISLRMTLLLLRTSKRMCGRLWGQF